MRGKALRVTFRFVFVVCFFVCNHLLFAQGEVIRLGWSPNHEPDLSAYHLYRDTVPGTMVLYESISKSDSTYTDTRVEPGETYYYKLTAVDSLGFESEPSVEVMARVGVLTLIEEPQSNQIDGFALKQNYPNPFNPATTIEYILPEPARVSIVVYNILGKEVRRLVKARKEAGVYRVMWDGRDNNGTRVAAGVYFYQMVAGTQRLVKQAVFQK